MAIASWQKLVFVLLEFLILLGIWYFISNRKSVQTSLHKLPSFLACGLQWYSLLLLFVVLLGGEMFGNIVYNDFYLMDFLDPDRIQKTFQVKGLAPDEIEDLTIPTWLRILSLASPFAGLAAFVLLVVHFVKQCYVNVTNEANDTRKWKFSKPEDMLLSVIMMPAVFILMSIRSTSRMWMVMTAFHVGEDKKTDMALFDENFELASVCQYLVVAMFAHLCFYCMKLECKSQDLLAAIKGPGFQGVFGWIAVGCLHSALLFFTSYMGHNYNAYGMTEDQVNTIKTAFLPKVATCFSIFSIQCTYNMVVICRLPILKHMLGDPTMKFNGTKLLLLLGPNQLKILLALSSDAKTKSAAAEKASGILDLSDERAMLLHSSLMCFECLAVVILNSIAWADVRNGVGDKLFYKPDEVDDADE